MLWNEGQLRLEFSLQLHLMTNFQSHAHPHNLLCMLRVKEVMGIPCKARSKSFAIPEGLEANSFTALGRVP